MKQCRGDQWSPAGINKQLKVNISLHSAYIITGGSHEAVARNVRKCHIRDFVAVCNRDNVCCVRPFSAEKSMVGQYL